MCAVDDDLRRGVEVVAVEGQSDLLGCRSRWLLWYRVRTSDLEGGLIDSTCGREVADAINNEQRAPGHPEAASCSQFKAVATRSVAFRNAAIEVATSDEKGGSQLRGQ